MRLAVGDEERGEDALVTVCDCGQPASLRPKSRWVWSRQEEVLHALHLLTAPAF